MPAWRVAEIEDAAEEAKFSVWRAWDILGDGKPCDEKLRDDAKQYCNAFKHATAQRGKERDDADLLVKFDDTVNQHSSFCRLV